MISRRPRGRSATIPPVSTRATAATVVALGAVVALAGDACHVASGTTHYGWDGVPAIWRSAIWFPPLVAAGVLALALTGRDLGRRFPPARRRTRADVLPAAGAVLALYALTAVVHEQPDTVSVVLTAALAVVVWGVWDPSPGAALGGAVAAVVGPLVEIGVVALGAAEYGPDSDSLAGVAPWLPCLYFAAGAVAFRLWDSVRAAS
jgi:hypothetical protein